MSTRVLLIITISTLVLAAPAAAVDPIQNGSFEDASFSPWQTFTSGGGAWFTTSAGLGPLSSNVLAPVPHGLKQAVADQNNQSLMILYQDITLPATTGTAVLTLTYWVRNSNAVYINNGDLDTGAPNQHMRIDLMDPLAPLDDTGTGVLQSLLQIGPGDPNNIVTTIRGFNISAHLGQTVRVRIAVIGTQAVLNVGIDNVHIDAPLFQNGPSLEGVEDSSVDWGDYDNDGDLDVLLSGKNTSGARVSTVYRNDAGVFNDISAGLSPAYESAVDWGDYDNDGDLDILLAGEEAIVSATTRVYRNNGGSFIDIGASLIGVQEGDVEWGDYDNDGDLDILMAGFGPFNISRDARVYENIGGFFVDAGVSLPGVSGAALAWGDFDNDRDLDILLTGNDGTSNISNIYRNTPGGFLDISAGLDGISYGSVDWGDYDNDGDLDILLVGDLSAHVYRNDAGSFVDMPSGLDPDIVFASCKWGDYDNDGDLDILYTGESTLGPEARIYRNDGGTPFVDTGELMNGHVRGSVAWGDYDGDNDLDFLVTGEQVSGNPFSRIHENLSSVPNFPPIAPSGLSVAFTASQVSFVWSSTSDFETPSAGLSYNLRIGTTPGGDEILSGMASALSGYRRIVEIGNVNQNLAWSLPVSVLPNDGPSYWSVQAVDAAFEGSPFATERIFNLGPTIDFVEDIPIDQGRQVRVQWNIGTGREFVLGFTGYSLWRRVDPLSASSPDVQRRGGIEVASDSPRDGNRMRTLASGTWDYLATVPARGDAQYSMVVPTLCDSTDSTICYSAFFVSAMTADPLTFWDSVPDSGYSVDNLAPGVPMGVTASYGTGNGNQLSWIQNEEADFQYYRIYRGTNPNFIPDVSSFVEGTTTPDWTDPTFDDASVYYKISAVDFNGNESEAASPSTQTGVEGHTARLTFSLQPNVPNPFRAGTSIQFSVANEVPVELVIYDATGRRVRTLVDGVRPAGVHIATWNRESDTGRSVASGIYFYRLRAGSFTQTRRMVLVQ